MATPLGFATTNTNASFVFNNLQASLYTSGTNNAPVGIPNVQALDFQSAAFMSGRQPGGAAFRTPSNGSLVSASNANAAIVMLDNMETTASRLGYTKNGAFIVVPAATAVVVSLLNTQVGTNSFAGDTTFATLYEWIFYNLSGLDGTAAVNATVLVSGTNGVNGLTGGAATCTIPASSRFVFENIAGLAVNTANLNCSINAASGTIAMVLMGK